jgi:hypothetical protein
MIYEWRQSRARVIIGMSILLVIMVPTIRYLIRSGNVQSSILPWAVMCLWSFGIICGIFGLRYPSFIRIYEDSLEYGNALKTKVFKSSQIEKLTLVEHRGNFWLMLCTPGWNYRMPYPETRDIRLALIRFAKEHNIELDGDWPEREIDSAYGS